MTGPTADFAVIARRRLAGFRHITVPDAPEMRRAAVVLCVVESEGGTPAVVVIQRAFRGRNAGQYGLPGGRLEAGETPVQAALRELREELGLALTEDDVLGQLDDFPATSGFAITPIVAAAAAGPADLRPNEEIHDVRFAGLDRLAAPDTPRWVPQAAGPPLLQMWLGPDWVVHAPTGALLWQFREVVLLDRPDARAAGFRQPDWTRR